MEFVYATQINIQKPKGKNSQAEQVETLQEMLMCMRFKPID